MEQIITSIITTLSPAALPLVVVIVAGLYFFFKFKSLEQDRMTTKQQRDTDSREVHDDILKLKFDVVNLKGRIELHDTLLSDINKQINILNTNLAILTEKIDNLNITLQDIKNDRQLQSK